MSYEDTIAYLYGLQKHGMKFGLDNIRRLMSALGEPHKSFSAIHVAGTNGKGSTSAMIESLLRTNKIRTGLFTSPHLVSFTERIKVNGQEIPEDAVMELADEVREAVDKLGMGDVQVQAIESQRGEYLLRVAGAEDQELTGGVAARIAEALQAQFGQRGFEALSTDLVGPRVGKDLRRRAILSVLLATVAMGIYIAFRFDARFGVGAAVALFHDVLITVGALSLANIEVDLTIVAALLTIIGYSVNDTVIISDRIRENLHSAKRVDLGRTINRSINETLSRTVLTTGATMLVVVALYLVGGPVIHGFAFSLMVGFVTGTYSSIFIASPIVEWWANRAERTA